MTTSKGDKYISPFDFLNLKEVEEKDYLTDLITNETED